MSGFERCGPRATIPSTGRSGVLRQSRSEHDVPLHPIFSISHCGSALHERTARRPCLGHQFSTCPARPPQGLRALQSLISRTISSTETRIAKTVRIEFQRFQRDSKSRRAASCAVSSIPSIASDCTVLFNGMLMVTVGS